MIQVRVLGIALDATRQRIVLLKPVLDEPGEGRILPIWIGEQEATSILVAISGEHAPRPLSHDLMKLMLDTLGADVVRVEVTRIDDGTFYAEIGLVSTTGPYALDARPSDAIALAVRTGAPILVADAVFDEAGVPAELLESKDAEDGTDGASADPDLDLDPDLDPDEVAAVAADAALDEAAAQAKLDEFKRFLDEVDPEDFER